MQDPGTVTRRRRSTAHSGQAGEHAQSALHKPQAGSTETWRLKHKLSLAFNLCCLPGNSLPVLSGASP